MLSISLSASPTMGSSLPSHSPPPLTHTSSSPLDLTLYRIAVKADIAYQIASRERSQLRETLKRCEEERNEVETLLKQERAGRIADRDAGQSWVWPVTFGALGITGGFLGGILLMKAIQQ